MRTNTTESIFGKEKNPRKGFFPAKSLGKAEWVGGSNLQRSLTGRLAGMGKIGKIFFLIGVIFASLAGAPSVSFGAVEYQQTGQSLQIDMGANSAQYRVYAFTSNGGAWFPSFPSPYVTTSIIDKIRLVKYAGSCPTASSIFQSIGTSGGNGYTILGLTTTGNYCDYGLETNIPSGTSLGYLQFAGSISGIYLLGSSNNIGYSYDAGATNPITGGVAFALCSGGSCSGALVPPVSSVTLTSPTSQTYTNNPINFVTTNYESGDECFAGVDYDLEWNSLQSVIVPRYNFNSCPTGIRTSVATSTMNLPYQGNYRVRARMTGFVLASSTPWTAWQSFGLGTTTVAIDAPAQGFVPQDCAWTDFGCGMKNAIGWAFIPDPATVAQFNDLTLAHSAPFSYVYDVPTVWNELFTNSATTTMEIKVNGLHFVPNSTSSITFISSSMISAVPYASTLRTLMGYILWFMFGLLVYRQVIKVHDK